MGTLAGSTIMLLTVAWGGSVLAGRCNLNSQVLSRAARPAVPSRLTQLRCPVFSGPRTPRTPSGRLPRSGPGCWASGSLHGPARGRSQVLAGRQAAQCSEHLRNMAGRLVTTRRSPPAQKRAVDRKLTRTWSLKGTGVTTDKFTPLNAIIMSATVLLYLIIQVPPPPPLLCLLLLPTSACTRRL